MRGTCEQNEFPKIGKRIMMIITIGISMMIIIIIIIITMTSFPV